MIAPVNQPCCRTCRFWSLMPLEDSERDYGVCRRSPPQFVEAGVLNGAFPLIEATEWCGEYQEWEDNRAVGSDLHG